MEKSPSARPQPRKLMVRTTHPISPAIRSANSGNDFPDAIDSLWKDGGARRIELQPLGDAAIEQLVETVLEGPVERSALHRVVSASQGSVLYARELVIGAVQEGRMVFDNGLWRLRRRAVSPPMRYSGRRLGKGAAETAA